MTSDVPTPRVEADGPRIESSLPSIAARALAVGAIVIAGLCGGLIGYSVTTLQSSKPAGTSAGIGALIGAVFAAGGVAIVAVLVLRAMAEWRTIEEAGDPRAARLAQKQRRL